MSELLHPGDVVLTRSGGIVGWAIPTFTRHFGESRTEATHCAVVVIGGALYDAAIVEALSTVRKHGLRDTATSVDATTCPSSAPSGSPTIRSSAS